jgi:hypothetical protein
MLILLGPPFEGTNDQYAALAKATGMVAYELRTKVRPNAWGLVRVLADAKQAEELSAELRLLGFRVALVDPLIAHDPQRPIVVLRGMDLGGDHLVLHLRERSMKIPYEALLTVVRGEVRVGQQARRVAETTSSAAFRAVVPTAADMAVFRENLGGGKLDAYAAADLHFATVLWSARIDARHFDFSLLGAPSESTAQDLDRLVDLLAERSGIRVDRQIKVSSVASFAARPPPMRTPTPAPGPPSVRVKEAAGDERFDAYSRYIAEAERQSRSERLCR